MPRKKPSRIDLRSLLAGGDRRSVGKADQVAALVKLRPKTVASLVACLWDDDPCVCMRAADALEKLSRDQAELLQPSKAALIGLLAETTQKEVRWHLAVMVPRLQLNKFECCHIADTLQSYLIDRSSIVKTFAMQGLVDLTRQDASLLPAVIDVVRSLAQTGTTAMRARGRKLLEKLHQS